MPYLGNGLTKFTTADDLTVSGTSELKDNVTVTGDVTASGTLLPTGDTAAGDDAALGFTSAEGLILTGQGSSSDITLKNDADATVFSVPTGQQKILFPDNARALFGDGSDLQIYHDGSDSYINDTGTGNLRLAGASQVDIISSGGEFMGKFIADGASTLYHNNVAKIATASTGVDVSGTITATDTCTFSSANNVAQLILKSTDADANSGPQLDLTRDSGSPVDGDALGLLRFMFDNDAGQSIVAAQIETSIIDASDSIEAGRLIVRTMTAGSSTSRLDFTNTETVFNDSSIDVDFRVESNGNANMIKVNAGDDFVGIGEGSPNVLLHVTGPAAQIAIDTTSGGEPLLRFRENGSTRGLLKMDGTNNMQFHTGADGNVAEVGRFDPSGNFLVGKTASGNFDQGSCELNNTGYLQLARDDGAQIFLSKQGSSPTGDMIALYKVNAKQGSIGNISDRMYIGSSDTGLVFEGYFNDCIIPFSPDDQNIRDNLIALGYGSSRFSEIFCANSTINTSDETEKQDIATLTSAEMTAAKSISALFKTYKWKDAVAAKGDAARIHKGVIAQDVQAAMSAAGLDAAKYSFWCSDTWWEAEETITNEDGEKHTGIVPYQTAEDAPKGATKRTRLGVRYPELLAFIGAATEQRLADIETRLTALEE